MIRAVAALILLAVTLAACERTRSQATAAGNPARGAAIIARVGCGACHVIPGVRGARGLVGPPLDHVASRITLAGVLPNTPANMISWLQRPQAIVPGNAMPDLGLSQADARDITAYLYRLN